MIPVMPDCSTHRWEHDRAETHVASDLALSTQEVFFSHWWEQFGGPKGKSLTDPSTVCLMERQLIIFR